MSVLGIKTNHPILDFVITQVLSIIYLSEASIPMVKWQSSENIDLRDMTLPPAAALCGKAIHTYHGVKMATAAIEPCLKTTGYSIQVLSQLNTILSSLYKGKVEQGFINELKGIALLQLQYCLEYIKDNPATLDEITAVLDGSVQLFRCQDEKFLESEPELAVEINTLYSKMASMFDIATASTMDLACVVKTISNRNILYDYSDRDDFLTPIVLEILNRRSRTGLFYNEPDSYASAPMGQQFFILNTLLLSYPFVMLDSVLEEVFTLFTSMYNIAYKEAFKLFTFQRRTVKYTGFDIGAIIASLDNISKYSIDTPHQGEMINNLKDSFLDFILYSYHQHNEKDICRLLRWYNLAHNSNARDLVKKFHTDTVFPKRIYLIYPGPMVDWSRRGIINQADPLFLCASLLSTMGVEEPLRNEPSDIEMDMPTIETIKMLFDLFSS